MADSDFEILDPRFRHCVKTSARVEKLFEGCRWAEGPAYFPAHRSLVFSDVPADTMFRFDEASSEVGVFRRPSGYSNGNTADRQGRLVTCEHGNRRVTRTEQDGRITVLADRFEGKRLNSPNDVVVHSDGSIWFTDPAYGIDSDYEGHAGTSEIGACHVYRIDAASGRGRDRRRRFRPPERARLLARRAAPLHRRHRREPSGERAAPYPRLRRGRRRAAHGRRGLRGLHGRRLRRLPPRHARGASGRAPATASTATIPDGTLIGKVRVPERVANVAFGGEKLNRLYICATSSLYAVYLPVNGVALF